MKKQITGVISALLCTTAIYGAFITNASEPVLVGHRGSLFGLENTGASFANGALRGYQYLETDFKLSADSVLLCTHDNDLTRLGGTAVISTDPADTITSQWLTQSRAKMPYASYLAKAQTYIDICKALGAKPLIELKWTDGINSKDCSNIPLLIDFLDRNGVRESCIILTSMKPCLEYIRANYPGITLQFLTGQYWANHFDWCVEHGIDVDIQAGYFDEETVKRFHDAGLKVNVWCANNDSTYNQYTSWGCDFITTDRYLPPTAYTNPDVRDIDLTMPVQLTEDLIMTQVIDGRDGVVTVILTANSNEIDKSPADIRRKAETLIPGLKDFPEIGYKMVFPSGHTVSL